VIVLGAFAYLVIITGLGSAVLRRWLHGYMLAAGGFCAGAAMLATAFFLLAWNMALTPKAVSVIICASAAAAGLMLVGRVSLPRVQGRWQNARASRLAWLSAVLCSITLWIYLIDAWTPPRADDAMRYHLAQLKDIVQHAGLVWRPYLHYNLPIYFSAFIAPIYMMFGGQGVQVAQIALVVVVLATQWRLCRLLGTRHTWVALALTVLTPWVIRVSTTVNNDIAVAAVISLGLMFLGESRTDREKAWLMRVLAFVALGLGLAMKYTVAPAFPWFLYLAWHSFDKDMSRVRKVVESNALLLLSIAIPSPFFIKHFLDTRSPFWPFFQHLFPIKDAYLIAIGDNFARQQGTDYSLLTVGRYALGSFLVTEYWLPAIWLVIAISCWKLRRSVILPAHGLVLYFGTWIAFQTHLNSRFAVYIYPALIAVVVTAAERFEQNLVRRALIAVLALDTAFGLAVLGVYSIDFFRYQWDRDVARFQQTTFYYSEYDWINKHLPDDTKLLVIVGDGRTYYLDKEYLKGDPSDTATIPWPRVQGTEELFRILYQKRINYILYGVFDWGQVPGGKEMVGLMEGVLKSPAVELVWERNVQLCLSRVHHEYLSSRTYLVKIGSVDGR
jgi:4-amino-4-deoxy-L-arabinose transferase-like glycosyltransferase